MGFDWRTPGLIREEIQRDKLRGRAGMKTWVFGKRLEKRQRVGEMLERDKG